MAASSHEGASPRRRGADRASHVLLALARGSVRRPGRTLLLLLGLTLLFAALAGRLELRTDGATLHPVGHPSVQRALADALAFGDGEELVILVTPATGAPRLDTREGLLAVTQLHARLAARPEVDGPRLQSVATLIDVPSSTFLHAGTLLHGLPEQEEALAARLERMRQRPEMGGLFLAPDGEAAAIHGTLQQGLDRRVAIERLDRWLLEQPTNTLDAVVLGPAVAESRLGDMILADLSRLIPIMLLTMSLVLLLCLRSLGAVLLVGAKMVVTLTWTVGLMALAQVPLTLVTMILPVLLVAMAITDETHVLALLQPRLLAAHGSDDAGRCSSVMHVLTEVASPVVLTSVSTALGLLSFLSVTIVPVRQFGMFAATGLILAMLLTFTLTPALAVSLPAAWFKPVLPQVRASGMLSIERALVRHRSIALIAGLVAVVAALPWIARLETRDAWIDNFDPRSRIVQADRLYNTHFWGSYRLDVVFAGEPGTFHASKGIAFLEEASQRAATMLDSGGVLGPASTLEPVARVLGLVAPLPTLPAPALQAVARLAALDPSANLQRLLTATGHRSRLLVILNDADSTRSLRLEQDLQQVMGEMARRAGLEGHVSGNLALANATVQATIDGQLHSIWWSLAGIALMLSSTVRRPHLVLVQLLPAVVAVVVVLAWMGAAGIPLGIATSLFAALTVGVGVDLALHLTCAFERHRQDARDPQEALWAAVECTAPGRRWSTLVLCIGFLVLTTSSFAPVRRLGVLLALAMAASYLATHLLLPRLLAR